MRDWEKLTQDPNILSIVQGCNILFSKWESTGIFANPHYDKMNRKFPDLIQTWETLNFPLENLGFVINLIEIPIYTSKGDRVYWSDNQLKVNDLNFAAGKNFGYSKKVWKLLTSTQTTKMEFKYVWPFSGHQALKG